MIINVVENKSPLLLNENELEGGLMAFFELLQTARVEEHIEDVVWPNDSFAPTEVAEPRLSNPGACSSEGEADKRLTQEEVLGFIYMLVLDYHAPPDFLISLDEKVFLSAFKSVGGGHVMLNMASFMDLYNASKKDQKYQKFNKLWYYWMIENRGQEIDSLIELIEKGELVE